MARMNDPGDYYREKDKETQEILLEMAKHQGRDHLGGGRYASCPVCQKLEKRLELARYAGD